MKQFHIKAADHEGIGHSFIIKPLNHEQYQIFNEQQERIATIEIDNNDYTHCRQSLDCQIELPLLNSIRDSILIHDGVLVK
ncbi:hypothetical protein [Pedobacter nyackensis]|uniref:Uncharacterized protein n=1 Tax=Pedobacter nyackensis TaxID=475255 RepID=A0A1W2CPD8_9SPHI|nr:hypothetical protein [Pedobacter nyackensis]SMC87051.1 hypothetical protein SAMN04488101_10467 [Pedobacter nyackensis]